jgi:hypothetical protein
MDGAFVRNQGSNQKDTREWYIMISMDYGERVGYIWRVEMKRYKKQSIERRGGARSEAHTVIEACRARGQNVGGIIAKFSAQPAISTPTRNAHRDVVNPDYPWQLRPFLTS